MSADASGRTLLALLILSLGAAAVGATSRGDPARAQSAPQQPGRLRGKPLLENDRVVVVEAGIEPGATAGMHRHGLATVIVCLQGATIKETYADGSTRTFERKAGDVIWREAGFQHDETNVGQTRLRVVAVQLK